MSGIELLLCFVVLLFFKVPLGVSFVMSSVFYLLSNDLSIICVAQRMVNSISYSSPLLAVPLFIFLGSLMNNTKLTDKIFDVASLFVGSVRGGLAYVNVLASLIFAGISGAALADVGGLGNIEIRAMRDEGYDDGTTMGVTLASSTIGPIFPPKYSSNCLCYGSRGFCSEAFNSRNSTCTCYCCFSVSFNSIFWEEEELSCALLRIISQGEAESFERSSPCSNITSFPRR